PNTDGIEVIRQRVYTHNARIADKFRADRILLAGDAAHIMPVWQGQGYNSGMRDAFNLAWKVALVVPNTDGIEVIRQRVYTHNARIADKFRADRILLAG
ncbi:FAD-dependent monooxygenase, partial [Staphylococcus aureus]|uniref:FAD-dependent monooxygenase n=1 Tax=Staphylococcus aureus TaxID=1280 RepID=UPI001C531827